MNLRNRKRVYGMLELIAIVVVWFVVSRWVLPRLGVPT